MALDNRHSPIDIRTIPILSVCQPYAHLIVYGPKRVENRTWATGYRGWIGIHAGKGRGYMDDVEHYRELIGDPSCLKFGAIIGVANLVACVRKDGTIHKAVTHDPHPGPLPWGEGDDLQWAYDDPWFEGPVGWVLLEARPIPVIECRGKSGLFRL